MKLITSTLLVATLIFSYSVANADKEPNVIQAKQAATVTVAIPNKKVTNTLPGYKTKCVTGASGATASGVTCSVIQLTDGRTNAPEAHKTMKINANK